MTYNVRGTMGLDRVESLDRIARVIERANVDLVALQELTCVEKDGVDPPGLLARKLDMQASFVCSMVTHRGEYGHALLSRFPVIRERHELLPRHHSLQTEPRSAVAHDVKIGERTIRIVSTHLSVLKSERVQQLRAIVDDGWLDGPSPVLFMGDLNCLPTSRALRVLQGRVRRAGRGYIATWPAPIPFLALDHVFVSRHFEVGKVRAVVDGIARWASDHVPLLAELILEV